MTNDRQPAAPSLDSGMARRLHRALTAGPEELFDIVQDPSPEVVRTAMKNRSLSEDHLLSLLRRRDLPEDLLKAVHQMERTGESHRLKVALAKNPGTPGQIILSLLPHLHLFELLDLCILPGTTPDQRVAAERQILLRLPQVPLGNKMTLARRGTATLVAELLREGDPQLLPLCLDSPRLKEIAIIQFLGGPKGNAETISMIARHPKWKSRPNVRLAILKSPQTPPVWFTLFLPHLPAHDLHALLASRRLNASQKKRVEEEIRRRASS